MSFFLVVQFCNAWLNQKYMSGDRLNYSKVNQINTRANRVDINDLMSRVRDDEKKQKKENIVFFSLIASVIVITGIIASL